MNNTEISHIGTRDDYVVTAMTTDGLFRVLAVRSTLVVEEGRRRHGTSRTATAALGRVMTGALLMAVTLDDDQSVTLRVLGGGPSGGVIAEATNEGGEIHVRGYMGDPAADLPLTPEGKLDVGGLIGTDGYVHVMKDLGLKKPYTGSAKIQTGEIGIDLAYYYTVSEQLPMALSLGVRIGGGKKPHTRGCPWVTGAGGLMVQVMPGRNPDGAGEAIGRVQANLDKLGSVSLKIQEGASPEDLVLSALQGVCDVEIMSKKLVRFACKCSRERAEATLMGLGKHDLLKLSREQEVTEVRCHFCNEAYSFTASELGGLALNAADRHTPEET